MAKARKQVVHQMRFFAWRVGPKRKGVYYADGRSNTINAGRYSLGSTDSKAALEELERLDAAVAVKHKIATGDDLVKSADRPLPVEEGVKFYLDHVSGPAVSRGATKKTKQRYKAVFDKFIKFCKDEGVSSWQQVTKQVVLRYGAWLDDEEYAYRTEFLELNTIKQAIKWLSEAEQVHIPQSCRFTLRLQKPNGTPTYCYEAAEVYAILELCKSRDDLIWLWRVIVILAYSGLRISELAQLEWTDIEFEPDPGFIHVRDESRGGAKADFGPARSTKTHRSRRVPMHAEVKAMLATMPVKRNGGAFTGPWGGRLKPDTVRNVLRRDILDPLKAKFPKQGTGKSFEDGRIHSFRHFFCSHSRRAGVSKDDVKLWLGHTDSKMTDLYDHVDQSGLGKAISKVKPVGPTDSA